MLHEFTATVESFDADTGTAHVRVMPWNRIIEHAGRQITFDAGSIDVDGPVPVNLDHSGDVLAHIGRVASHQIDGDGFFATLTLSDTAAGRDARTLLRDGVITDVSAGVLTDPDNEYVDDNGVLHRSGTLHHVAIVRQGAFGNTADGSKVLSVHNHQEGAQPMSETGKAEEVGALTAELEDFKAEFKATTEQVDDLRRIVSDLSTPGNITEREPDLSMGRALQAIMFGHDPELANRFAVDPDRVRRDHKAIQEYALGKDNTTVGAGVVPDFAKSEVISIVDANRPINNVLRKVPIEDYGMTLDFPIVATKPSAAVQSSEHDEPDSTQIDVNTLALALGTYAGASDVSIQLLERSMPSYLQVLYEEYAHVLALRTEIVASDALIAGAGGTAVLADLSADDAATIAAVATRKAAVMAGTRQLATHMIVGTTRWTQLESLVDTDGRPHLQYYGDGVNALGANWTDGQQPWFMGMRVVVSPDATATDCIILNANRSLIVAESAPQFFNVDIRGTSLSVQLGVYQYYGTAVAHAAGIQTLTPS